MLKMCLALTYISINELNYLRRKIEQFWIMTIKMKTRQADKVFEGDN